MNDLSSLIPTLRRQRGKFLEILEKLDSKKIVKYSRILLEIFEKIVKKKKKKMSQHCESFLNEGMGKIPNIT